MVEFKLGSSFVARMWLGLSVGVAAINSGSIELGVSGLSCRQSGGLSERSSGAVAWTKGAGSENVTSPG